VVERLRQDLRTRGERIAAMRARQRLELLRSQPDVSFEMTGGRHAGHSPDAGWMAGLGQRLSVGKPDSVHLFLYDVRSKKEHMLDAPARAAKDPLFSADGKFLLFPSKGDQIFKVPFNDGRPDYKVGTYVGDFVDPKISSGVGFDVLIRQRGRNRIFASDDAVSWANLYDVDRGARIRLKLDSLRKNGDRIQNIGFVGETDRLWIDYWNSLDKKRRFIEVEVDSATGELTEVRRLGDWDQKEEIAREAHVPRKLGWTRDGREIVVYGNPDITARAKKFQLQIGTTTELTDLDLTPYAPKDIPMLSMDALNLSHLQDFLMHPTKSEGAIHFFSGGSGHQLIWYDFDKKKILGHVKVKGDFSEIHLSPDGEYVIAHERNGGVRVMSVSNHLAER